MTMDRSPLTVDCLRRNCLLIRWFYGNSVNSGLRKPLFCAGLLSLSCFVVALGASAVHGTIIIPGNDVGLLEHYGNIAIMLLFPMSLALIAIPERRYLEFLSSLPAMVRDNKRDCLKRITCLHTRPVGTGVSERIASVFIVVCCLVMWISNAVLTLVHARSFWGHDVFDSWSFPVAWIATRIIFLALWVIVLPAGILSWFRLVVLGRRTVFLLHDAVPLRLASLLGGPHAHRAYLRFVSSLLWPLFPLLAVFFALFATHGIRLTHALAAVAFTGVLVVVFPLLLLPYVAIVRRSMRHYFQCLSESIEKSWSLLYRNGGEPHDHAEIDPPEQISSLSQWYNLLGLASKPLLSASDATKTALGILSPLIASALGKLVNLLSSGGP